MEEPAGPGGAIVEEISSSSDGGSDDDEEGGEGKGAAKGKKQKEMEAAAEGEATSTTITNGGEAAAAAAAPADAAATAEAEGEPAGLAALRLHTRYATRQLALLVEVLALEPPPVLVQYAPGPQPALGTHRLWAADVLAVLLLAGSPAVDAAVAASGALPAVVALALSLDKCSALHFRALQMVDCSLRSGEPALWRGLMEPGLGAGIAASAAGGAKGDKGLCAPLHEALAQIGERGLGFGGMGVGVGWPVVKMRRCCPPTHRLIHPRRQSSTHQLRTQSASPWASAPGAPDLPRASLRSCSPPAAHTPRRPATPRPATASRRSRCRPTRPSSRRAPRA
jgi:hypothetical protein